MKRKHLNRSRDRMISFNGEVVFDITDKQKGNASSRWWNLQAYLTEDGDYTVGIGHITTWTGKERDLYWAYQHIKTVEDVLKKLRDNTPQEDIPTPDVTPRIGKITNPHLTVVDKVYEKDQVIPKTLIDDWTAEREAYINLVNEAEQLVRSGVKASEPG